MKKLLLVSIGVLLSAHSYAVDQGLKNQSEAGIVITTGNTETQSYNLKHLSEYGWDMNLMRLTGQYLRTASGSVESIRYWNLGLRYERGLTDRVSLFVAEQVESNIYAGVNQKYNTDVGAKIYMVKEDAFNWFSEAGYRLTIENPTTGSTFTSHGARLYTELNRIFNPTVLMKLWIEYLPNFTTMTDWRLNTEISLSAVLTNVFSVKSAYLLNFDNQPNVGVLRNFDTTFTTSLVANF